MEKETLLENLERRVSPRVFTLQLFVGFLFCGLGGLDCLWGSFGPEGGLPFPAFFALVGLVLLTFSLICLYKLISLIMKRAREKKISYPIVSTGISGLSQNSDQMDGDRPMEKKTLLEIFIRWIFRSGLAFLLVTVFCICGFIGFGFLWGSFRQIDGELRFLGSFALMGMYLLVVSLVSLYKLISLIKKWAHERKNIFQ